MTYCAERTKLLASAGREIAEKYLPKPFALWFSSHDTGIQMTIVMPQERGGSLPVWKGSIWHHPRYEFNDRGDTPGLQPEFAFAHDAIEAYFAKITTEVEARNATWRKRKEDMDAEQARLRDEAIERARTELAAAGR